MLDNEIIKSIWKYFGPLLHLSCMPWTESPASQHKGLLLRPIRDWHFQKQPFSAYFCALSLLYPPPHPKGVTWEQKIISRNILPSQIIAFLDVAHEKSVSPVY